MGRFRLDVAYDGTGFAGWQVQPERRTVQGELSRILALLGERSRPTGAGRTDAGVHALANVAHVTLERSWSESDLSRALCGLAPDDLAVRRVIRVEDSFHARFDAISRTYHYAVGLEDNPFFRDRRWRPVKAPDPGWIRSELQEIVGVHDFASLAKSGTKTDTTTCYVLATGWDPRPGGAILRVTADRFLYGMVRALVGALVVGGARGEAPGFLSRVLEREDRAAAGEAAPAAGLYLAGVTYPGESEIVDQTEVVSALAGLDSPPPTTEGGPSAG